MITPAQAREEYGFGDCTEHEDNLALGLYNAAQALFKSNTVRMADKLSPLLVYVLQFVILLGIVLKGASTMLLLLLICIGVTFIPRFLKIWKIRSTNSGMLHIQSEQGNHFLMAWGTCVEKKTVSRKSILGRAYDYKLRVRMNNGTTLDDVLIMKELYDALEKRALVCVMMADSPNAKQIIAAPHNFANTVLDKKKLASRQFESVNPKLVRKLTTPERDLYVRQYQNRIAQWKKNFLWYYLVAIGGGFAAGCVTFYLYLQALTILLWFIVICFGAALIAQTREFKRNLHFMENAESLSVVDVMVHREEGYVASDGAKKKPNSRIDFKDADGSILWTRRTVEDLKVFRHRDRAVLVIHDNEMIPLCRDTDQYEERI